MSKVKCFADVMCEMKGWQIDIFGGINPPLELANQGVDGWVPEMFEYCGREAPASFNWMPEWLEPEWRLKSALELMEIFSREGYNVTSGGSWECGEADFHPGLWMHCGSVFHEENKMFGVTYPANWFTKV